MPANLFSLDGMRRRRTGARREADRDPDFARKVARTPGGEKLFECIQCGTCSGVCPVSEYMDYTPRQIIGLVRQGFRREVLSSRTIWLCASCYACAAHCPAGIKITDLMYALKRMAIAAGLFPARFPTPVLAQEFYKMVKSKGRSTESWLMMWRFLRTQPLDLVKMTPLGMRLFLSGRIGPGTERIERRGDLKSISDRLER